MIVLLLTTKDEGDVLEQNVAHHLASGVDHVGVADNESSDGTRDRLRRFGDAVTVRSFHDFAERHRVRMEILEEIQAAHGRRVRWAGVSDTDEFFWLPGTTLRACLAAAPDDVVCASFHQKLFLPTESDPPSGPVYLRQTWRSSSYASPLHSSYVEGKSIYRTAWLRRITSEHRNPDVPHPWWGPETPAVHHYMIRDEDQFVMKVRRLTAWRKRRGLASRLWWQRLRRAVGLPETPHVAGFKKEWWDAYREGGEEGLRRHYRTKHRIQTADLPRLVAEGHLVRDTAFADFMAARAGGAPSAGGAP